MHEFPTLFNCWALKIWISFGYRLPLIPARLAQGTHLPTRGQVRVSASIMIQEAAHAGPDHRPE
jgi:ABC-type transport system involved in cytochrome c biogenesis permease subunit